MRAIVKGREPSSLTQHRLRPSSDGYSPDYNNYNDKNALRKALVEEQRGLCCYCMTGISSDRGKMKIEHWQCQKRYPTKQLNYRNLLAACWGGDDQPGVSSTATPRRVMTILNGIRLIQRIVSKCDFDMR